MVGSRTTTHYGIEAARKLAYQLAYVGVTVVSGGARGLTPPRIRALERRRPHAVRVGTGINRVFPPENKDLFERIARTGRC